MKKIYKTSMVLILITFSFWLLETATFLIIEGWHYKATSKSEILCDSIFVLMANLSLWTWFLSVSMLVDKIMRKI